MQKSLQILALTLLVALTFTASAFADAAPAAPAAGVVNINTADVAQLTLLPRVGEKAAQRIIEYRTQHGPFKKTSELMQVKGFGRTACSPKEGTLRLDQCAKPAQFPGIRCCTHVFHTRVSPRIPRNRTPR